MSDVSTEVDMICGTILYCQISSVLFSISLRSSPNQTLQVTSRSRSLKEKGAIFFNKHTNININLI